MIKYEHGTWGLHFLFRLAGSVFPKALVWAIPCSMISAAFMFLKISSGYNDENDSGGGIVAMLAVASSVSILGFLVVFRSNQAWSRFWEGADLLQQARGQWVCGVSSLFAFCSRDEAKQEKVSRLQGHVVRLMSLLYAESIARLCDGMELERLDLSGLDMDQLATLDEPANFEVKIELIVHWIQRIVADNISDGVVTAPPPIVSRVFNELSNGVVKAQAARKIKEIQFPFHYAQMLGVMLVVYSCGVPAMCAYLMTTYYGTAGSTFLNVFVLWCVNYLAVEIEQPFGDRPNDLPLADEMKAMNDSLRALASRAASAPPKFSGNGRTSVVRTEKICLAKEGASTLFAAKEKQPRLQRSMTVPVRGFRLGPRMSKERSALAATPRAPAPAAWTSSTRCST